MVEMIVAVGLFSVVMTVAVGSLLSIVDANRKAQAQEVVINNLNFALENMARNIRVGTAYHCGASSPITTPIDCNGGSSYFAFEGRGGNGNSASDQIIYRLQTNQIEKSIDGGATFIGITAPEITIEGLNFYVEGALSGDGKQPKLLITLHGSSGVSSRAKVTFNLETLISQRVLDL